MKRTTVLIVDDSRIFRNVIEQCLSGEKDIEVIGSVMNGAKALEFMRSRRPDIVTLDIEMPEMNGLETLTAIEEINVAAGDQRRIGTIMLSSLTKRGADITIQALNMGAFDFITKPEGESPEESFELLRRQLTVKIRSYMSRQIVSAIVPLSEITTKSVTPFFSQPLAGTQAILIGVSTGGPHALSQMLPCLCKTTSLPIFVVQHMPPTFTESLAANLDSKCSHHVIEARNAQKVEPKTVYLAPGGRHLILRRTLDTLVTMVNEQPAENGFRPSVDVMFRSAASALGGRVIAMILTGMGDDGVKGIAALKRNGAYIIAQDESSSVVWGMPGNAVSSRMSMPCCP